MCYNLTLETDVFCLSTYDVVSKIDWKGKGELGQRRGFHCISVSMTFAPSPYCVLSLPLVFSCNFCKAMGLKDQLGLLFWCLMPKWRN
jgi:hypothetical protein